MIRDDEVYKIGKLGKPHGVRGEVSMMVDDDVFDRVEADYVVLRLDGILVPFFLDDYRFKTDDTALLKFCDIDTKEQAAALTNCEVLFPRQLADNDSDNDLSLHSLIGFRLIDISNGNVNGQYVGTISSIDNSTINTLFCLLTDNGEELLIPAAEDLIVGIDPDSREVIMNVPEGLL